MNRFSRSTGREANRHSAVRRLSFVLNQTNVVRYVPDDSAMLVVERQLVAAPIMADLSVRSLPEVVCDSSTNHLNRGKLSTNRSRIVSDSPCDSSNMFVQKRRQHLCVVSLHSICGDVFEISDTTNDLTDGPELRNRSIAR